MTHLPEKINPQSKAKINWILIAKYLVSIAIVGALMFSQRKELLDFFHRDKHYHWLAVAFCTMTCAFLTSYMRWHQLANAIGVKIKIPEAIQLGFIGSFFNVLAFGVLGGDSLKMFYASRHAPGRTAEVILSVFLDRVIGLIVMCGFAAAAYLINGIPGEPSSQKTAIEFGCSFAGCCFLMGVAALLVILYFPNLKQTRFIKWLISIPKVGGAFEKIMNAAALYSERKIVIPIAMLFSLCTNLLFATAMYTVALAIAPDVPQIGEHFVIAPIAMVANSVPLPMGVGGMESALAFLYLCFDKAGGVTVALGYRLTILFISLVGWVVWLNAKESMKVDESA